jgi:uncharacterized protein (TIGR03000 family)
MLVTPSNSYAARHGGGGHYSGHYGGWGGGYYGGRGYGWGRGYGGWGWGLGGLGLGLALGNYGWGYPGYYGGYYGSYGSYGYPSYSYSTYAPSYYYGSDVTPSYYSDTTPTYSSDTPYYSDSYGTGNYVPANPSTSGATADAAPAADRSADQNVATVDVNVPGPDCRLTINGNSTRQRGTHRVFETESIAPDQTYTCDFTATWMQNGREVSRTQTVRLQAGDHRTITFDNRTSNREVIHPEDLRNNPAPRTTPRNATREDTRDAAPANPPRQETTTPKRLETIP